jgi:hypothetical protein
MLDRAAIREEYQLALTSEWREMPAAARADIPAHLRDGLDRYICDRVPTGGDARAAQADSSHLLLRPGLLLR